MVDVAQIDCIAVLDRAAVGLFLARQHAKERGFTGAVGANDANDAARGEREGEVLDKELVAHGFLQALDLDHLGAETLAVRDDDLGAGQFFALGLVGQFVIAIDTCLLFGLAGFLALAHPFQFAFERFLARLVFASFLLEAFGLLFQPA